MVDAILVSGVAGFFLLPRVILCFPSEKSTVDLLTSKGQSCIAGLITVFINGIPQEVPSGPFDTKKVFGQDAMLLHSSGELVPMNDCGTLFRALHNGESYILVSSRSTCFKAVPLS